MIAINFKDVGQGDSIILEWENNNKRCIGIIDSNLYQGRNPVLEYLSQVNISCIDFIILTHFHYDHFSGMADIFHYCYKNKISIKFFLHTFASIVLNIYDEIFTSQKVQSATELFMKQYDTVDSLINEKVLINCYTKDIKLSDNITLSFLAPSGKQYEKIAKQVSRKKNRLVFTQADINKLSTIMCLQFKKRAILFTSDAVKQNFRTIRGKINQKLELIQIPHHGSKANIDEPFWDSIDKTDKCKAVISVGDDPKNKLPDVDAVEYFDTSGYYIHSTNFVFGLKEYYHPQPNTANNTKGSYLDHFSMRRSTSTYKYRISRRFNGDQVFLLK